MPLRSSHQDSSLEDEKVRQEDTIFFAPLNPFGDNPDEEEPSDDLSKPRKVHIDRKFKIVRTPSTGSYSPSTRHRTTYTALCWQIASTR